MCHFLAASFNQASSLGQVAFVNDVISLENADGFMPADLHGHLFTDASPGHVPDGTAPEIVKVQPPVGVELFTVLALRWNPIPRPELTHKSYHSLRGSTTCAQASRVKTKSSGFFPEQPAERSSKTSGVILTLRASPFFV